MVLDALLKTLHVLAVVLWVGGMVFAHFYLRPSLTEFDPPTRLALMCSVLKRFFGHVLWAALIVLATGLWMIGRAAKVMVQAGMEFNMPLAWTIMATLGVSGFIRPWLRLSPRQIGHRLLRHCLGYANGLPSIWSWVWLLLSLRQCINRSLSSRFGKSPSCFSAKSALTLIVG
mgnify:CR=1 FL=1